MLEMRTSERRDLKTCPQRWYWSQVEGLRPLRAANPLWFGSAVHEGLAGWYIPGTKRGTHPSETFDKYLAGNRRMLVTNDDEETEYQDARALGIDMLDRYVERWGEEPERDVIASEREFQVVLPRPEMVLFGRHRPAERRWLRYVGTWDGVHRDLITGEIRLAEHKTAASIWADHLPLDDQAGSYWAVASKVLEKQGVLKAGEEIAGIEYNFLRKALGDTRPVNADGLRTNKPTKTDFVEAIDKHGVEELPGPLAKLKVVDLEALAEELGLTVFGEPSALQPPAYFERFMVYRSRAERGQMIRRIQDEAVFAEAYRKGWLPVVKAPDLQKCRGCQFRRMCELDESGDALAVEEFKEIQFTKTDPYAAHRKDVKK